MSDLHDRLVESLTARLQRARAAERYWGGVRVESRTRTEEDYVLANDPATEIRQVEALLRVVETHGPDEVITGMCYAGCGSSPCLTIRDLAAGEGIEP